MADINLTGDSKSLVDSLDRAARAFLEFDKATSKILANQRGVEKASEKQVRILAALAKNYSTTAINADRLAASVEKIRRAASGPSVFQTLINSSRTAAQSVKELSSSLSGFELQQSRGIKSSLDQATALESLATSLLRAAEAQAALRVSTTNQGARNARNEKTARLAAKANLAAADAANARASAESRVGLPRGRGPGPLGTTTQPIPFSAGGIGARQGQLEGPAVLDAATIEAGTAAMEKFLAAEKATAAAITPLNVLLQKQADRIIGLVRAEASQKSERRLRAVREQTGAETALTNALERRAKVAAQFASQESGAARLNEASTAAASAAAAFARLRVSVVRALESFRAFQASQQAASVASVQTASAEGIAQLNATAQAAIGARAAFERLQAGVAATQARIEALTVAQRAAGVAATQVTSAEGIAQLNATAQAAIGARAAFERLQGQVAATQARLVALAETQRAAGVATAQVASAEGAAALNATAQAAIGARVAFERLRAGVIATQERIEALAVAQRAAGVAASQVASAEGVARLNATAQAAIGARLAFERLQAGVAATQVRLAELAVTQRAAAVAEAQVASAAGVRRLNETAAASISVAQAFERQAAAAERLRRVGQDFARFGAAIGGGGLNQANTLDTPIRTPGQVGGQTANLAAVREQNAALLAQEGIVARLRREAATRAGIQGNIRQQLNAQTATLQGQIPIRQQIATLARQVLIGGNFIPPNIPGTPGFNANLAQTATLFGTVSAAIRDMGRLIGISLIIGSAFRLVQALEDAVTASIELENAIAEVQTIDTARISTDRWADSLTELSNAFGIDVLNQAEAAYQTLSNQVATGADATAFLTAANKLAVTAVTDVSAATNLLTAALNAYNIDVTQAEEVSAIFFKTVELGRVRIDEMAESFGRIAVPANQIGVSLEELTAAIATTTINGVKFNEASTLVRNIILKLIRPTDALQELFEEIGVSSGEAAIATFGFGGFLAILEEKTKGSTTELGELFGRIRAITGALVFSGEGLDTFNESLAQIESSKALEDFRRNTLLVLSNTGKQLDIEKERFANFFRVEVGRGLTKGLLSVNDAVGGVTNVLRVFSNVVSAAFIPVLAVATIRLIAYSVAAIQAGAATRLLTAAFTTSGGITTLLIGAATAVLFLAQSQESLAEQNERLAKETAKRVSKTTQLENKAVADAIANTEKLFKSRARLFNQPIAINILQPLNKEFKEAQDGVEAFEKAFKKAATASANAAKKLVTESTKAFDKITADGIKATKSIDELFNSLDRETLTIQLEGQENVSRSVQLITERLEALNKARKDATRTGDLETFTKVSKEIKSLTIQRGDLVRASNETLTIESKRFQKLEEIFQLVGEEAKLRRRIAEDSKIRAVAAEKIRIQQELATEDLRLSFKILKGSDFSDALASGDQDEIRRTLADRVGAAERVIALQRELGIERVKDSDIALQIVKDQELADNRIQAAKAKAIIEERKQNDALTKSRLDAFEQERKIRGEAIAAEFQQLRTLSTAITEGTETFLGDAATPTRRIRTVRAPGRNVGFGGLAGAGGGGLAGVQFDALTGLEDAFGKDAEKRLKILQDALNRIARNEGVRTTDPRALRAIEIDRETAISSLRDVLASVSPTTSPEGRQTQRDLTAQAIAQGEQLSLVDLETSFAKVDATIALFQQVLDNLTKSGGSLFQRQVELRKSQEIILGITKKIADAQTIELGQTEKDIKQKDRLVELQGELEKAIQTDIDIRKKFDTEFPDADKRAESATIANGIKEGFEKNQAIINGVMKTAIAATQPEAISNAVAGEEAKKEITAASIRAELEARANAVIAAKKAEDRLARLGPGAAERAALTDATSGSARRKAVAEARAQDRADKAEAARRVQDARIEASGGPSAASAQDARAKEAAKIAAEIAAAQAGPAAGADTGAAGKLLAGLGLGKSEIDARQELADEFPGLVRTEIDARAALNVELEKIRLEAAGPRFDPLSQVPGRTQQLQDRDFPDLIEDREIIIDEDGNLSTELNDLTTVTDLLNETMTSLVNQLIREGFGDDPVATSAEFRADGSTRVGIGDPARTNQFLGAGALDAISALSSAEAVAAQQLNARLDTFDRLARIEENRISALEAAFTRFSALGGDNSIFGFAEGGPVHGTPGRDKIPAMLSNREFVVRASQAQRFMPQLLAMNSGRYRPRGFADGGPVDVGGIRVTVNESSSPQATAREVAAEINRGVRNRTIRMRRS